MEETQQTTLPETKQNLKFIKSADELMEVKEENKEQTSAELKKTLGFGILFILALNFIFDSSIFYIPQYGINFAGKASLISWILITMIGIYIAMCYGELISMFPSSGGIYEVSKITFGTFISFIVGWLNWLVGNIGVAISITAGLEVLIPEELVINITYTYILKAAICLATIFLLSYLAKKGKDIGNSIMFYFTIIILFAFALLIIPMFIDIPSLTQNGIVRSHVNFNLYEPFFSAEDPGLNFALIFGAIFISCTSLFGLSAISYLSGEVKEPEKVLPKVFKWSMITVGIVTLLFVIGSFGVLDTETYAESSAYFADIAQITLGQYSALFVSFLIILAGILYFFEGLGWILSGPRLIYSIAKDKLFPTSFAKIDEEFQQPVRAIRFQAKTLSLFIIIMYIMYIFNDYFDEIDPFTYFLTIFIFFSILLVCITLLAIPVLRERSPEAKRPYKAAFGNILPYIIIIALFMIIILWVKYDENGLLVLFSAIALLLLGFPIYALLVVYFDPDVYTKLKHFMNYFSWLSEPLILSRNIRDELYGKIGDITGKKVLLYGTTGTRFTIDVAEKVGNTGRVYVTDLSERTIFKISEKIERRKITQITAIHDEHQVNRVYPHIPQVNAIISTGMLGHIQDLRKVAKEMAAILPDGGRIVFKEEVDVFSFVPNIGWIAQPEKVVEIFREEGISINYVHVKRTFWTDLFVYGVKSKEDVPVI
ncbi:amino acid permease [Candidatus Woesearchaeota archaeon]|nr:amino acid permease [Candidatus Woesearchaeota archaeon]